MHRLTDSARGASRRAGFVRAIAACLLLGVLAACQTASPESVLDVADASTGDASPAAVSRTEDIGSGPVVIGLVTTFSARSPERHRERDRRDGAVLAAKTLGDGAMTLAVYNSDGNGEDAVRGATLLVDRGAKLLIGPSDGAVLRSLTSAKAPSWPALIGLTTNDASSAGSFAFVTDDIDSAIEASAFASDSGRKRILVIAPKDMPAGALQRLTDGLRKSGATLLGPVPFATANRAATADHKDTIALADAVLLAPGLDSPAAAVSSLRATRALSQDALVLGNSGWSDRQFSDPVLFGSLFCRYDRAGDSHVSERFKSEFGRPMSTDAAYAFDAVALAAGLARGKGAAGLTEAALTSTSGFRGVLGAFRLEKDGKIRRNCSVFRLEKAGPNLVDAAPDGF